MGVSCKKISDKTYMLTDFPLGVSQYLLLGESRALLIDTGYGKKALARKIRGLTDLPLLVVNTHLHPDHSKGNKLFGEIMVGEADLPSRGVPSNDLFGGIFRAYSSNVLLKGIVGAVGRLFLLDGADASYSPLPDRIDLGNRTVRVIPCPGHTAGSALFSDENSGILFAGDAINGALWLFTLPSTTTSSYAELLESLRPLLSSCREMRISHSKEPLSLGFVDAIIKTLREANPAQAEPLKLKGTPEPLCVFSRTDDEFGTLKLFAYPSQFR